MLSDAMKEAIDSGRWEPDIWIDIPAISEKELKEILDRIIKERQE